MKSKATIEDQNILTPVTEIDLRSLSEERSERDTYLSIYLNAVNQRDRAQVDLRLKAISKALPKDLHEDFEKTQELIGSILDAPSKKGERGRIIFASAARNFCRVYRVSVPLETMVVLDNSPFVLPLARLHSDYQDYALLLLDSQEARLFLIRSEVPEEKIKASIDLMNKHKKGGWSQMRFNRLRKGAIKSFLTEVSEDMQNQIKLEEIKGLVVMGPGEAKGQLVEMLPISWKHKILGVMDAPIKTPSVDLARLGNEVARRDQSREKDLAEELKKAVLKGQPVAYGLLEVREALAAGRVNHLLLDKSFALPQMICKKCQFVHQESETCPVCGGQMLAMDLEELYQQSEKTGAEIVLVKHDDFLEAIGGVGALLRY